MLKYNIADGPSHTQKSRGYLDFKEKDVPISLKQQASSWPTLEIGDYTLRCGQVFHKGKRYDAIFYIDHSILSLRESFYLEKSICEFKKNNKKLNFLATKLHGNKQEVIEKVETVKEGLLYHELTYTLQLYDDILKKKGTKRARWDKKGFYVFRYVLKENPIPLLIEPSLWLFLRGNRDLEKLVHAYDKTDQEKTLADYILEKEEEIQMKGLFA